MVFSVVVNTEYLAACHNSVSVFFLVMKHYLVLDIHATYVLRTNAKFIKG